MGGGGGGRGGRGGAVQQILFSRQLKYPHNQIAMPRNINARTTSSNQLQLENMCFSFLFFSFFFFVADEKKYIILLRHLNVTGHGSVVYRCRLEAEKSRT